MGKSEVNLRIPGRKEICIKEVVAMDDFARAYCDATRSILQRGGRGNQVGKNGASSDEGAALATLAAGVGDKAEGGKAEGGEEEGAGKWDDELWLRCCGGDSALKTMFAPGELPLRRPHQQTRRPRLCGLCRV